MLLDEHPPGHRGDRAKDLLVAARRRTLPLVLWHLCFTVWPALRRARRAVMRAVQRVEEIAVPAIIALGRGIPRTVQRVEERGVPALIALAVAVPRIVQRAEEIAVAALIAGAMAVARAVEQAEAWLVPALPAAGRSIVAVSARGQDAVATGLRATGRGLVEGAQRAEAFTAPAISPRVDGRRSRQPQHEYVPAAWEVVAAPPRAEVRKQRLRSAGWNAGWLAVTASLLVISVLWTADITIANARREAAGSVSVAIRRPENPTLMQLGERSYIHAASGQQLQVLDREENRRIVALGEIPLPVQQAILTAEDQRFYEHEGYDIGGIGRALVANVEAGDITQGGSTITQQLAKSAVGSDRTLQRKFEELAYAVALEEHFSKEQLLEQYLNQVYFGENAYGVAAAAEEYFGITDVSQLRAEHGALLAAMIRSPNSANPRTDPAVALRRRNAVLEQMVPQGFLTQADADVAMTLPLGVIPPTQRVRPYDFIADSVIREFLTAPEFAAFGETVEARQNVLYRGGLRIHSSLDTRLQDIAQGVIAANFPGSADPFQPTGAIVSVEPSTGRILAAHSGVDYGIDQLAIPTQGRRQPGSAAKPFAYAEALRRGFPPDMRLSGAGPAYYEHCPGWERSEGGVQNYGNASYGTMDMPSALRQSVNTATVQLSQMVGVDRVLGLMGEMGVNTQAATGGQIYCSIPLGAVGITPLEAAAAYATFANGGVFIKPHFIDSITDRFGNQLYVSQIPGHQALSPEANALMVQMLQGVVTGGTGTRAQIPGWPVAGKTGTTTDNIDAWFVGFTPTLSTAMWMGVPTERVRLNTTGGGTPATLWQRYMSQALAGQAPVGFPQVAIPQGRLAAGEPTTVPGVTGLPVNGALGALTAARLGGDIQQVPHPSPPGTVIAQSAPPGTAATSGDTILLIVSTGGAPPPPG